MRLGIQAWGAEGDIRPLAALAAHMASAGHDVRMVATSSEGRRYDHLAAGRGFSLVHTAQASPGDLEGGGLRFGLTKPNLWFTTLLEKAFFPYTGDMLEKAAQLAGESDILLGDRFMYPLAFAAEAAGKPYAAYTSCHGFIPPGNKDISPFHPLGTRLSRAAWTLSGRATKKKALANMDKARGRLDLPHWEKGSWEVGRSKILNLVGVSPLLIRTGGQWDGSVKVCGYFHDPAGPGAWTPPDGLREFILSGTAPVFMTLGGMPGYDAEAALKLFSEAARLGEFRAIIQLDWGSLRAPMPKSENIFLAGGVPGNLLFPHCAAVVHNCPSRTVHEAVAAGAPSIGLPIGYDQPFWAKTLHELGVASKPLYYPLATPAKLAKRVSQVLSSPVMKAKAEETVALALRENGVALAMEHLEDLHENSRKPRLQGAAGG